MSISKQALCCVCGNVRQCRRPRNYRRDNYWLYDTVDRDWHRETGELKCPECNRVTVHAIILPDNDSYRDHAETLRKIATGWTRSHLTERDYDRIRTAWRRGTPQNPYKRHLWWKSELKKARKAGQETFQAICMVEIPVPTMQSKNKGSKSYAHDELVAPNRFHEVDYEDPETGLWWYEVDCTDCLYRANAIALNDQRDTLKKKINDIVAKIDHLDARTVAELLAKFVENEDCES